MKKLVITIDGPAASGKSTIAKQLAKRLEATFLDTGAMYRAVTLAAMRRKFNLSDKKALALMLTETDFRFVPDDDQMKVFIDNAEITQEIRSPEVTSQVHHIASDAFLREKLVEMQRRFADEYTRIVTEGRDQGTVAFADADVKFFLTADLAERARRRAEELTAKGLPDNIDKIRNQIDQRDSSDRNRDIGPLVPAGDAIVIDTTNLSIDEVVQELLRYTKDD